MEAENHIAARRLRRQLAPPNKEAAGGGRDSSSRYLSTRRARLECESMLVLPGDSSYPSAVGVTQNCRQVLVGSDLAGI